MHWLIAGLGNPGLKYRFSRHNIGFWAVDLISTRTGISLSQKSHQALWGEGRMGRIPVILSKPQTFMNISGLSVQSLASAFDIDTSHLVVIHDDMDLPPGGVKIRTRGGSGGHKGVQSVIDHLGRDDFVRIRIGTGHPGSTEDATGFVLSSPTPAELDALQPVIHSTELMITAIINDGPQAAMNLFNG
ncbi:MAG: aminoacyl-tRNA hydrolase [bacterium]